MRALLAYRAAAGKRQTLLAEWLLLQPDVCPSWLEVEDAHWRLAERQSAAIDAIGIAVVPAWEFPEHLRRVRPLPVALFVRGDKQLLNVTGIGMVGSRNASAGSEAWARSRAAECASSGELIISGGARGIDRAAHEGALAAGGKTLAYLGVAGDKVYPAPNKPLFARMLRMGGALVSEHPPLTTTYGWDHAMRNRLISAQSHGLFVVEAGDHSGTLGTAQWAHRLGVPLFVPPASVGGERSGIDKLVSGGIAKVFSDDCKNTPLSIQARSG